MSGDSMKLEHWDSGNRLLQVKARLLGHKARNNVLMRVVGKSMTCNVCYAEACGCCVTMLALLAYCQVGCGQGAWGLKVDQALGTDESQAAN